MFTLSTLVIDNESFCIADCFIIIRTVHQTGQTGQTRPDRCVAPCISPRQGAPSAASSGTSSVHGDAELIQVFY